MSPTLGKAKTAAQDVGIFPICCELFNQKICPGSLNQARSPRSEHPSAGGGGPKRERGAWAPAAHPKRWEPTPLTSRFFCPEKRQMWLSLLESISRPEASQTQGFGAQLQYCEEMTSKPSARSTLPPPEGCPIDSVAPNTRCPGERKSTWAKRFPRPWPGP